MSAATQSETAYERILHRLEADGRQVKRRGGGRAVAQCPAHDDRNPSLSIRRTQGRAHVRCFVGCEDTAVLERLGLEVRDLFDDVRGVEYRYDDNRIVRRTPQKRFYQMNVSTIPQLYRLSRVTKAVEREETVYLVEGEQDVHTLESEGAVATTAPQGSSSVGLCDLTPLHGGKVVAVVDRDKAGQKWAGIVRDSLEGRCQSLRFVEAAAGKDATDHIMAGHDLSELVPVSVPVSAADPYITETAKTTETAETEDSERLRVWDAHELDDSPMQWLAIGTLPQAAVAVLVGEEGIGKSLWWVTVAAHLTTGRPLPAIGLPAGDPRNVLLILTEDLWGEVRSRLEVAGADLRQVKVLCSAADGSGVPTVPGDHQAVYEAAKDHDVALIVADAWLDVVPSGIRVADTQQARQALQPWSEISKMTGASTLLITHTNRLQTTSTRDRMGGTIALRQKARMTLVAATRDDERGRVLYVGPDKTNNTATNNAVRYDLEVQQVRPATEHDPGTTARLSRPIDAAAPIQQLIKMWAHQAAEDARPPSAGDRARDFLLSYMREHGEEVDGFVQVASSAAKFAAKAGGHNPERLAGAVTELGGVARPGTAGGPWVYRVPVSAVSADFAVSVIKGNTTETATETESGPLNHPPEPPEPPETGRLIEAAIWNGYDK